MIEASNIRERMQVLGSDGKPFGKVEKVRGKEFELSDFRGKTAQAHPLVPLDWVSRIEEDKVFLSLTQTEAESRWSKGH